MPAKFAKSRTQNPEPRTQNPEPSNSLFGFCLFQAGYPVAFFPLSPFPEEFDAFEPFEDRSVFFPGRAGIAEGVVLRHVCEWG